MELFRIENITKQFSTKFVLQNFSFTVLSGQKINISGRSGIGKTTLFRLLLGFEKPDAGHLFFQDKELKAEQIWHIRRKVAYVSQDLNIGRGKVAELFHETLGYKVNLSLKKDSDREIREYLTYFELPETILHKNIEELSGGEKQRVAIVNALLLKRNIFFLDEITSALDVSLKTKVLDFFLGNSDFTVLYISHDLYLPENSDVKILKLDEDERGS